MLRYVVWLILPDVSEMSTVISKLVLTSECPLCTLHWTDLSLWNLRTEIMGPWTGESGVVWSECSSDRRRTSQWALTSWLSVYSSTLTSLPQWGEPSESLLLYSACPNGLYISMCPWTSKSFSKSLVGLPLGPHLIDIRSFLHPFQQQDFFVPPCWYKPLQLDYIFDPSSSRICIILYHNVIIISKRIRWNGHVACKREIRNYFGWKAQKEEITRKT